MRLVIFGATGGTGTHIVDQALARGDVVTAFVRQTGRLKQEHAWLRCVCGDVMDTAAVDSVVANQDAVVCALGNMPERKSDLNRRQPGIPVCSVGTAHILQAMTRHAVRRIVVETSVGVGDSRLDGRSGAGSILRWILREVMQDKEAGSTIASQRAGLDHYSPCETIRWPDHCRGAQR